MPTVYDFERGDHNTSLYRTSGTRNSTTMAYDQEYDQSTVNDTKHSTTSDDYGNVTIYVYDHHSVNDTKDAIYYGNETAYSDYDYHSVNDTKDAIYYDNETAYPDDYDYHSVNDTNTTLPTDYDDVYTEFVYQAFGFERPIYLYIWEILVIVTVLVNLVVIWVLLQKRMRSVTNLILVAIAISDSMTGLVTLPTYIMVYSNLQTADENMELLGNSTYEYGYMYDNYEYINLNTTDFTDSEVEEFDAYILSKPLCEAFMISKFFLSKMFHTISIWLTVFLGVQRYIAVAYPFKTQMWFTSKNTITICAVISFAAPVLHLYHLIDEKTVDGFCSWVLNEKAAAHIWITLLLRHLIPCIILSVTTVLFVIQLNRNSIAGSEARVEDNRRISKIVIAIVIVFLIPEIPYGMFLLYLTIVGHLNDPTLVDLKRNRVTHAIYELLLVLTFHLNFYIYTLVNKRFRLQLKRIFTSVISKGRFQFQLTSRLSNFSTRRTLAGASNSNSISQTRECKGTGMKSLNESSDTDNRVTEMRPLNLPSDNDSKGTEMKLLNPPSDTDRIETEMKLLNPSDTDVKGTET